MAPKPKKTRGRFVAQRESKREPFTTADGEKLSETQRVVLLALPASKRDLYSSAVAALIRRGLAREVTNHDGIAVVERTPAGDLVVQESAT
jgi:hypothetical protein